MKLKSLIALLISGSITLLAANAAQLVGTIDKQTKIMNHNSTDTTTQYVFKIKKKRGVNPTDVTIKDKDGKEIYKDNLDCPVEKKKCILAINKEKINKKAWPLIFNFFVIDNDRRKLFFGNIMEYDPNNKFKLIIDDQQGWGVYAFKLIQLNNPKYADHPQELLKKVNEVLANEVNESPKSEGNKQVKKDNSNIIDSFELLNKAFKRDVVNGDISENNFFKKFN